MIQCCFWWFFWCEHHRERERERKRERERERERSRIKKKRENKRRVAVLSVGCCGRTFRRCLLLECGVSLCVVAVECVCVYLCVFVFVFVCTFVGRRVIPYHPSPALWPLIRRASCISFVMIVTLFAWIAHKFASSNKCTKNASVASCNAIMAVACHR